MQHPDVRLTIDALSCDRAPKGYFVIYKKILWKMSEHVPIFSKIMYNGYINMKTLEK